mgnify:FL=1
MLVLSGCLLFNSFNAVANNNGVDPTKPLSGSKQSKAVNLGKKLVLESIFHGSNGGSMRTAIINGKPLKVNDTIGEYTLVAVNDNNVVLRSSEKRVKLSIFADVVKSQQ